MTGGKRRVVISNISPVVDGGRFPAKAVTGSRLVFTADVFADGHDMLNAWLMIREEKQKKWTEVPMELTVNDKWKASYRFERTGRHVFRISGIQDHFTTWYNDLLKKDEAGQDTGVELLIGAGLLEQLSAFTKSRKEKELLADAVVQLKSAGESESLQLSGLISEEIFSIVRRLRDPELITQSSEYIIDVEDSRAAFSTWYELFPRSASPEEGRHGTFNDVVRLLPRIANMGFDVLYLPPVHPIGRVKRKGKNNSLTAGPDDPGSPWAVGSSEGGHKEIHPQLGTPADFRNLVKEAKKYGIDIALDIAFQCAPDHPYVSRHPEWFRWRPDGTVQYAENPPKKYEDILPLNFESSDWKNLWLELRDIVLFWIGQGVTIFRVDNPHTKSFYFWEWMITEIRKEFPEVIFLAEAFTRPTLMDHLAKSGFTQSYTYYTWRNSKQEIEQYMTELTATDRKYFFRPNFWPNTPDILPPHLTSGGENAHIIRLLLAATLSSNYGLYGPVYEFNINTPHPGKEEYTNNEKYEIHWWDWRKETKTSELIMRVNHIRKNNPALQDTYNISFAPTSNENIICYLKYDEPTKNRIIVVVNLDPHHQQEGWVGIPSAAAGLSPGNYLVRDLLSGDKFRWKDEWNFVRLNPHEIPAHIFKVEQ